MKKYIHSAMERFFIITAIKYKFWFNIVMQWFSYKSYFDVILSHLSAGYILK